MSALHHLVHSIIDYAGLFPPAGLPMQTAVENYATYVTSPYAWMLRRLIVPASRLEEFESLATHLLPDATKKQPWRIGTLVPPVDAEDGAFDEALMAIESFNERHQKPEQGKAVIDAIEICTPTIAAIQETAAGLPPELAAFLEIPHVDEPGELIEETARHGLFAKIRTGGMSPELIPPSSQVARFIMRCAEHNVGFKATAGLHHPLRGEAKLSYEDNAIQSTMHGFINVFVAALLAHSSQADLASVTDVLNFTQAAEFEFSDTQVACRGLSIDAKLIQSLRATKVVSFGSCSFIEPTTELAELPFATELASS